MSNGMEYERDSYVTTKPCFIFYFSSLIYRETSFQPIVVIGDRKCQTWPLKPSVFVLHAAFPLICWLELEIALEASEVLWVAGGALERGAWVLKWLHGPQSLPGLARQ